MSIGLTINKESGFSMVHYLRDAFSQVLYSDPIKKSWRSHGMKVGRDAGAIFMTCADEGLVENRNLTFTGSHSRWFMAAIPW